MLRRKVLGHDDGATGLDDDFVARGYACTRHVASEHATHVVLKKVARP